jgi:ribonuclease G
MAKEICISSTPHETRLAILEDDQLAEIYYERENEYTLAGSIYNGRVTRVLPGMQSAFVDLGLERDAFLYVTDFMELEDSEESDELEKAAASGANQPPREVRHTNGGRPAQQQRPETRPEPSSAQRPEAGPAQRGDRSQRDRRPAGELVIESTESTAADSLAPAESSADGAASDSEGPGGSRRWRGRRHRRGARGQSGSSESGQDSSSSSLEITPEPSESEVASEIQASAGFAEERPSSSAARAPRASSPEPVPFVLPGESLRKYGGAPADEAPRSAEPPAPVRPSGFAKPSTLIDTPIEWDGSGLLPGESISRHRNRQSEPAEELEQPATESAPTQDSEEHESAAPAKASAHHVEEVEYVEETQESELEKPGVEPEFEANQQEAEFLGRDLDETTTETTTAEHAAHESTTADLETECIEPESGPESDASASHNIDPLPPHGFRLFGFGKKKDEEAASKPASASVAAVSSYAPGAGHIEEEVIEGEEFDTVAHPRHGRKAVEQDLDEYEEETLPPSMRTGELGEMLQEAHLDHKIQLNFDDKGGDDESFDDDEDEEEDAVGTQPADATGQPRRDRNARGGRGRGRGAAPQQGNRRGGPTRRSMQTSDLPIISDLLKPGQEILVQIAKEPIAKKGARITSHIALPGRFLVFMPTVSHIGVSRKIASDEERQRLKRVLVHERGDASGGFIVRTAAEGASEEDLRADLRFLMNLWNDIKQRSDASKSPALIYHDLSLIERILRDQVSSNFANIWVDSEADYERIVRFLNRFSPSLVRRVKLYTKETPLFEHFGIQDEISKALRSKVWLKSGGSIVINQTEALVAIDINTGKYVGKSARLEDTIVKTNLDAVPEIVRQIRLRDLGGIIVIDFIDMDERKNRFKVLAALEEALKADRAPTKVLQFNDFGLVAITRKRVKQSLERTLSVPCATCQATGMVKSPTTVCNEIYTELRKMKRHFEGADVLLRVHPETVKVLKANNASWLVEFEELTAKNILVKSDATLHPEQFDIQG